MTRADVEAIRAALSDPDLVLDRLGLEAHRDGARRWIACPSHQGVGSAVVHARAGVIVWHCRTCKAGGDVFALIAAVGRLAIPGDFAQVKARAAELAGLCAGARGSARDPHAR